MIFHNYKLLFAFSNKLGKCVKYYSTVKPIDINSSSLKYFYFHSSCHETTKLEIKSSFSVLHNFITEEDENKVLKEAEPYLTRLKYEFDHWDDAIHGYRETEKSKWTSKCAPILLRVKETSFGSDVKLIPQVHILDLSSEGIIKPHIDSVRFCGNTVSGLCLLSDAVMRLVKEDDKLQIIDILLPRRGLYIMKDDSRYKYTHEILANNLSYFGDKFIERNRRISVIFRNPPQ